MKWNDAVKQVRLRQRGRYIPTDKYQVVVAKMLLKIPDKRQREDKVTDSVGSNNENRVRALTRPEKKAEQGKHNPIHHSFDPSDRFTHTFRPQIPALSPARGQTVFPGHRRTGACPSRRGPLLSPSPSRPGHPKSSRGLQPYNSDLRTLCQWEVYAWYQRARTGRTDSQSVC